MQKEFTHVYITKIPEKIGDMQDIFPESRRAYIESAKNPDVRRARYYVWRLLATALKMSLGKDIKDLEFTCEFGKWSTDVCRISLSHSGDYAAVALSSEPVGVDIESLVSPRSERFAERIFTEGEMEEYKALPTALRSDYAIRAWSKKEAIFKSMDKEAFIPQKIDTGAYLCTEKLLSYPTQKLVLAIAHAVDTSLEIYENTEI